MPGRNGGAITACATPAPSHPHEGQFALDTGTAMRKSVARRRIKTADAEWHDAGPLFAGSSNHEALNLLDRDALHEPMAPEVEWRHVAGSSKCCPDHRFWRQFRDETAELRERVAVETEGQTDEDFRDAFARALFREMPDLARQAREIEQTCALAWKDRQRAPGRVTASSETRARGRALQAETGEQDLGSIQDYMDALSPSARARRLRKAGLEGRAKEVQRVAAVDRGRPAVIRGRASRADVVTPAAPPAPPPAAQQLARMTEQLVQRVAELAEPTPADLAADIPVDVAQRAHEGTSWSPERRATQERESYAAGLAADWARLRKLAVSPAQRALLEREWPRYRAGMRDRTLARLGAMSRVVSSMIAGPSNFPGRRMAKRNETADRRTRELLAFRESAMARLERELRRAGSAASAPPPGPVAPTVRSGSGDVVMEHAPAENRVRLIFPGKPSEEVRTQLKSHGFRWAPSKGAWSAYPNPRAMRLARELAGV